MFRVLWEFFPRGRAGAVRLFRCRQTYTGACKGARALIDAERLMSVSEDEPGPLS